MAEGPGQRAHRRVGTMVRDKYRIDAFIATGSMANVYAATHRNGSRVALKILHRELATDPSMAERFKREGYFANAIGHPGVVRAIDDDLTEDGCAFIVMELLEGENLDDRRIRLGGRIPLSEALQVGDAMLEVLAAAHNQEVLHRDLKPENVFLTRKNEVKLLDFGVARFNDGRSSSEMTGIGMVLGTPAFMPPEQALGRREEVDARSDIWGVGATLFTVIAGEAVHEGGDAKTKLIATARKAARPLRDVAPEIPRAVASVIDRALAFDKIERWADANAMREALRWARMSLDDRQSASPHDRITQDVIPPPVTRRTPEDEPTLAGRSLRDEPTLAGRFIGKDEPTLAGRPRGKAGRDFDDNTARRSPVQPKLNQRPAPASEDVITSAPPVTQRDKQAPPMPMSEGPTFSLRNDPIFSLRKTSNTPNETKSPSTERIPRHQRQPIDGGEDAEHDKLDETLAKHDVRPPPSSQRQPSPISKPPPSQKPPSQKPIGTGTPPAGTRVPTPALEQRPFNTTKPFNETKPLAETKPASVDTAAIFRAALANTAFAHEDANEQNAARKRREASESTAPRPAAGMPPEGGPAFPTPPSIRTAPGIGGPQGPGPIFIGGPPPPKPSLNSTMPMPAVAAPYASAPPQPNATFTGPPPAYGTAHSAHSAPPAGYPQHQGGGHPGSLPPMIATSALQEFEAQQQQYEQQQYEQQQQQQYDSQPLSAASDDVRATGGRKRGRVSLTPENPGPLLATIAPKRSGGAARVLVPIMIGVLAGIGTYVVVVRQRAANASHGSSPAAAVAVDPSASASTAAAGSGSAATAAASPSSSASSLANAGTPPSTSSSASTSSGGIGATPSGMASVASIPPKKKRPRPRPAAAASNASAALPGERGGVSAATADTATTTAPEPTSAPTPTTPAPAPTPQDSLPRKDPDPQ